MKRTIALVPLLMISLTFAQDDQDKEQVYDTIDRSKLNVSEKGLAPLNVRNGQFALSYKGSVANWVDVFRLYQPQDEMETLLFKDGIYTPHFEGEKEENPQLVYTKLSDDLAMIALEKEKFGHYSIQYVLRFLEKNTGIATLLILDGEGLASIISNIAFKWQPLEGE